MRVAFLVIKTFGLSTFPMCDDWTFPGFRVLSAQTRLFSRAMNVSNSKWVCARFVKVEEVTKLIALPLPRLPRLGKTCGDWEYWVGA
jgi:hypothetical protein